MNRGEAQSPDLADLRTTVRVEPGLVVVELVGTARVSTVGAMRAAFGRARAIPGLLPVVALVEAVTFLDPLGVGVLALEQLAAHEQGREFIVCGINPSLGEMIANLPKPVSLVQAADLDDAYLLAGAIST